MTSYLPLYKTYVRIYNKGTREKREVKYIEEYS
nr:MAG TPA: hypothetical protein [Caudoviricetes sp.]